MAYILAIETATTNCSVALSHNGNIIAIKEDKSPDYSHGELLHQFIEAVIKEAGISVNILSAIAVSKGPGSYTGLRIGVSAAKGLCFSLDIPLIAISTLEILAHQVSLDNGLIVPVLDARRMEAYTAVYTSSHVLIREIKAEIFEAGSFSDELKNQNVTFVGNAVDKLATVLNNKNAVFIKGKLPSSKELGKLAYQQLKIGNTQDVAYFEPFYLKDFVALKAKH